MSDERWDRPIRDSLEDAMSLIDSGMVGSAREAIKDALAKLPRESHAIDKKSPPYFMEPDIREIQERAMNAAFDARESGIVAPRPSWCDVERLLGALHVKETELVAARDLNATDTNQEPKA